MTEINPQVRPLIDDILSQMQGILGENLVGLYLFGSLVTGDFDPETSDIDLLAVTATDIDEAEFTALQMMHADLALKYPTWEGRIEIAYASRPALRGFKTQPYKLGIISPGEPFHIVDADPGWLMNWYVVQEKGVTLFGPSPQTIIDPLSNDEYVAAVRRSIAAWRGYELYSSRVSHRGAQAYAILTMCRGLYTHTHGGLLSKRQAAEWAQNELPEWAPLIRNALVWRRDWRDDTVDHAATLGETRRFVKSVIDKVLNEAN